MSDGAKRSVYHHEVPTKTIDVYRVLLAFEVSDPCVQHAVKKLLCLGKRIGGKSEEQDVREAIWTLNRWLHMREEEQKPAGSEATEEPYLRGRERRYLTQPTPARRGEEAMSDEMLRIAMEALRAERDDLVRGIDLVQQTAVKWAIAFGGNTPLALIAQQLRDLIGDRATSPSVLREGQEGMKHKSEPAPKTCEAWCGTRNYPNPIPNAVWFSGREGYCKPACRDAGKPLHPATCGTPT